MDTSVRHRDSLATAVQADFPRLIRRTERIEGRTRPMQRTFQITAWTLAAGITALSLVPPTYRPTTAASHNFEHLVIFLAAGFVFGAGYPDRPWIVATGLATFCGAIEIAQMWAPGRHGRLSDFIVDAAAALLGLAMAAAFTTLVRKAQCRRSAVGARD
jgi:VanZ family protein